MGGRGSGHAQRDFCAYQVAEILDGEDCRFMSPCSGPANRSRNWLVVPASGRKSAHGVAQRAGRSAAIPRAARQGRATAPAGRVATHAIPPGREYADGGIGRTCRISVCGFRWHRGGLHHRRAVCRVRAMWSSVLPASTKRPAQQKPAVTRLKSGLKAATRTKRAGRGGMKAQITCKSNRA